MGNFEQKKLNISNINNGQKFTSGSQLTADALNNIVEGINVIDKKFIHNTSTGKEALIIDNGTTNTSNFADNRAIQIGNTQSIGTNVGALRFWSILNGSKYHLDVSPTKDGADYETATLGETNKFKSVSAELVQVNVITANNNTTHQDNFGDNRAIKIGNTQSIGTEDGALRFWNISEGDKFHLDISPTTRNSSYIKPTLGATNSFRSIRGDMVQAGNEKLCIKELWTGNKKTLDIADHNYKLFIVNIYYQMSANNYFVFNELIFWNVGQAYGFDGSDHVRRFLSNDQYIDINRSGSEIYLSAGGSENFGIEALYGILLH